MNQLLGKIFDTSRYNSMVDRDRARMVYGMIIMLMIFASVFLIFFPIGTTGGTLLQLVLTSTTVRFYVLSFYLLGIACILVARYGYVKFCGVIMIIMWSFGLNLAGVQSGLDNVSDGMTVAAVVLIGGLLNGTKGLVFGSVIAVLTLVLGLSLRTGLPPQTAPNSTVDLFTSTMFLGVFAGLTYLFLRFARLARTEGMAVATQDRLKMAEIAARITQRVAQRISLTELLNDIVTRVCEEFPDIYHAQVFLIDPRGDSARLVASTGPVGKKLIEQQHSLGVGSLSVIGQVTYQGKSIVAQAGSSESVHRRNEFLPDTQSEAAFPLKIGTVVIGALDLQSKRREAFTPGLIEAFSSLADSVALAIDNVRQFERAEARIHENQQLVEQTRTALREVERLNERLTGRAWSEYLRGRREDLGVEIDFETNAVNPENDWTNTMAEAIQFNHFVQEQQADRQVIAIPLRVRGQVVGAMEFELDEQQTFTPEDLSLVQEVSDRFGLAAENTRLVEESQRIAQREALVNEISSRLQAANNIEATLTEAARSLRDALKANKVAIRLGAPPASNGS